MHTATDADRAPVKPHLGLATALLLSAACAGSHQAHDAGRDGAPIDASIMDTGPAPDALTERLELTEPLGSCDADEEARCGCIAGLRRCDTCGDPCPTGSACDENAGVCRRRDAPTTATTASWSDTCGLVITDGSEREGSPSAVDSSYCHTGKVCGANPEDEGSVFSPMTGHCYPVSFCQAAARAVPPVETLRCVYSDGSDVVDGPSTSAGCPVGDPREPFCGGACGDGLRCPRYPEVGLGGRQFGPPAQCAAFSEDRAFGLCVYLNRRCGRGADEENAIYLGICEEGYGEPCACLVTHPQRNEPTELQGYMVLASVCRDYQRRFPDSTECVDAHWDPIP